VSYYTVEKTTPITLVDGHHTDDGSKDEELTSVYEAGIASTPDGRKVFGLVIRGVMTHMCYEIERPDGDPHFSAQGSLERARNHPKATDGPLPFYFDAGRGLRASYSELDAAFQRLGMLPES
jgi:hypothetical protein